MLKTIKIVRQDRIFGVKAILLACMLVMGGAMLGAGIVLKNTPGQPHVRRNPIVGMKVSPRLSVTDNREALAAADQGGTASAVSIAVHEVEIAGLKAAVAGAQSQADKALVDGRAVADREVNDINRLTDRLNVSDAKQATYATIGGICITLFGFIPTVLAILDFLSRRREMGQRTAG